LLYRNLTDAGEPEGEAIDATDLLGLLGGCATIMEGSGESVTIETNPAGALCDVDRTGTHLGTVAKTPGSVRIDKSKNDLTVYCKEDGFQPASVTESPKFVGTTFGNIVAGGLIGVVVDAASGANYEYPTNIHLDMAPAVPAIAPVPAVEVPATAGPASGART
jgi:hypothetical protein